MKRKYAVSTVVTKCRRDERTFQMVLMTTKANSHEEARGIGLREISAQYPEHNLFSQCCITI